MNQNLTEVLRTYSLGSADFCSQMANYSKPALIGILADLLTIYFNDRNSSMLREFLTTTIAGYQHCENKIGYNGFKITAAGQTIDCEVKPKNIRSSDFEEYNQGQRKNPPPKLNGSGNFTDYTWGRLKKDLSNAPNMLVSGFVDGRLLYILEFPFNTDTFIAKLKSQLDKRFPNGDQEGLYLRGANFTYRDYLSSAQLLYLANDVESFRSYMNRIFYHELLEKNQ